MDTYAYLNAVLDSNPSVTKLVLATDAYATATGPVRKSSASASRCAATRR